MLQTDFKREWRRQKIELIIALFKIRLYHLEIAQRYTITRLAEMSGSHRNAIWVHVNGMYHDEPYLPRYRRGNK